MKLSPIPFPSRLAALIAIVALAAPLSACSSTKVREKPWQLWRRKAPAATTYHHPDRIPIASPPAPLLGGLTPEGGVAADLPPAVDLAPGPSSEEIAQLASGLPEPDPLRRSATLASELKTIHFGFDSAELLPEARAILDNNVLWLRGHRGAEVQIEGHTDEQGTHEYNLLLGERRAKSVKAYLSTRGIDDSVLHTISYGEERPISPGTTDEVRTLNRRAQFLVY